MIVPASHATAYAEFLWKFLYLGNWAWHFWGVKFWSRDFGGVLIFAPIRSSLSLEIGRTPLGLSYVLMEGSYGG